MATPQGALQPQAPLQPAYHGGVAAGMGMLGAAAQALAVACGPL